MPANRVNATLSPEQAQAIHAALATLRENLPFLIDLTPDERKGMLKFGEKNRSFVAKAHAIAAQHPEILPASFNLAELQADVGLVESLYPLLHRVTDLQGQLEDTYFAAGSEAYAGALLVYQYAKAANLASGVLEDALDDLGKRFARRSPNPTSKDPGA
ncbi:MAG: hypothetical protein ACKN9T_11260 [Candidatus Methylumidiphilus sp.]